MHRLHQKLLGWFQVSDSLLLPTTPTRQEISRKPRELEAFGADRVLAGFRTMRDFFQELTSQNASSLGTCMDRTDWDLEERFQSAHSKSYSSSPSVWE